LGHFSIVKVVSISFATLLLAAGWNASARAEQAGGGSSESRRGPVYQRHAYDRSPYDREPHDRGARDDRGNQNHYAAVSAPQINAGSFQRPYPYHLDYYRMRYGGSYAPYFGNLYGPPQVVTAPPYYGPYYGGYGGYGISDAGGYGPPPNLCPCPTANDGDANAAAGAATQAGGAEPQ
jgi:hypothetical protein